MSISAKSSDLNSIEIDHLGVEHDGYNPDIQGVCSGDYVDITFCLDCGQIHDFVSPTDDELKEYFEVEDDESQQEDEDSDRAYDELMARKYGK